MVKKTDKGYEVQGTKQSWLVSLDLQSCNCPKFKYYLKGQSPCHHIEQVVKSLAITRIETPGSIKWNKEDYKEPLYEQEFVDKYGEELFKVLKLEFEIIVMNGRVRLL